MCRRSEAHVGFSTVSQIGYMMLGIGIGTPLAITAASYTALTRLL